MNQRVKLFLVTSLLFVLAGPGIAAQEGPPPPLTVVFWSDQGPVAVERSAGLTAAQAGSPDAEVLMRALLRGPTAHEAGHGLQTAFPEGTGLAAVVEPPGQTVVVRLKMAEADLAALTHDAFEAMVQQTGKTLLPLGWRDLRLQVQHPDDGGFVSLADFLPQIEVPRKPSVGSERDLSAHATAGGQPPAPGQAQPQGALSGKTVYVSAGHGWEWNSYKNQWKTQRPPYPSPGYDGPIIEDHNNGEAVNQYLLHYLWNAGAQVFPVRERDMNPGERIVDDSDPGFSHDGWRTGGGYGGGSHWVDTVSGPPTHSAEWQTTLPADGRYAVYVWYEHSGNRTSDARYTVHHSGGETTVHVNQRVHGYTWHYLGTFGFKGGAARVTLTNQSSESGKAVIADAVRFGGGSFDSLSGIDTIAPSPPHKPWWEVAAYYYTQKMGMGAGYGDVTVRPTYARWEHAGTGDDAVYVSWHSNGATGTPQWSYSGTETYAHNGSGLSRTGGSLDLRHAIHTEVVQDIRAGWDGSWIDRGEKTANLGELRLLWDDDAATRMPGALIEIGFHDHPGDTDDLKDPRFNQLVARALYQGIAKYYNAGATLLPEPPQDPAVENLGGGSVRVSWKPPATDYVGLRGHGATGYRVYTSEDGIGWSNGTPVGSVTEHTMGGLNAGQLLFVRVTATNAGGESFPTETLAVRLGGGAEILLVNGFDRLNESMTVYEYDPVEHANQRMLLDRMNTYDYVIQHAEAIEAATSYPFDSTSNEAVKSGRINLNNHTVVDWILGEESTTDETLDATERSLVQAFTTNGGALFISGSEIGYHLASADPGFLGSVLRASYGGDDAGTYSVYGTSSAFQGLGTFHFDAQGMYDADWPDRLATASGSTEAVHYATGSSAGVQYVNPADTCERLVYFGFPFETIRAGQRQAVMGSVMGYLDECMSPEVDTSIGSPNYGSVHNTLPTFSGTAQAQGTTLTEVQVQIERADGQFWNGSMWTGTSTWVDAAGTSPWSYALPGSITEGDCHLRARGRAVGGYLDETPAETLFTYDATPPAATSLVTPTGGVTITALPDLILDWTHVPPDGGTELHYRLEVDGEQQVRSASFYAIDHIADGEHTWRVRVEDEAGNTSSWTGLETFFVHRRHAWLPLVLRDHGGDGPQCVNLIQNGGFEADAAWLVNPEDYPVYSSVQVHSGARSGIAGFSGITWSSVRQDVTIPAGTHPTLRFWLYPISDPEAANDWQYVTIWDEEGGIIERYNLELVASNAQAWRQGEFDLSDFAGERITLVIGAKNTSEHTLTRLYIDDVELEVCE